MKPMSEELDFIAPKKTVGRLISVDVLEDIKAEIKEMANFDNVDELVEIVRIINKHIESEGNNADSD